MILTSVSKLRGASEALHAKKLSKQLHDIRSGRAGAKTAGEIAAVEAQLADLEAAEAEKRLQATSDKIQDLTLEVRTMPLPHRACT